MTESENSGARESPAAPGVALRAARTAQNLSVGDVARHLRLSVAQVEALEASAFERLPGQVFVRGFIRNYARLLKLDPDPLLRDLAPALAPEQEPRIADVSRSAEMPATRAARWPWYAFAAVALVAALAVYEFTFEEAPQRVPAETVTRGTISNPAPQPVADAPPPAPATPAAPSVEDAARGADAATAVVAPPQVASAPSTPGSAEPPAVPAAVEAEIVMTFDRDSWVEIHDSSGRTIFSQLNRAGTEQRMKGRPPLVAIIGNARGVRLTYNDRVVDLTQYMKNDVARLTLE